MLIISFLSYLMAMKLRFDSYFIYFIAYFCSFIGMAGLQIMSTINNLV